MSNQYSARPIDSSDLDNDRLRTLLDNLNNLKSKLHHFTVIDELGQPLGEITDLILDAGHQLNLVIALADADSVLLNGRRIKKVSVQTQSVFVDITKADTQFLPQYSPSESASFPEASEQPLPSPTSPDESFPDLTFSEETPSPENVTLFHDERPSQPTAEDLELAASLFTTEPDEAISIDTHSLTQDWELPHQTQNEDVFGSWNEATDSPSSSFSFERESASESLANELEHLDLQLDNDWSELRAVSETEDTSNTFELNVDLEPLSQEPPALDLGEVEDLFAAEPSVSDESANPFAGALPDFSVDAPSPSSEELPNLDWSNDIPEESSADFATASVEELPDLDWSDGITEENPTDFTTASAKEMPDLDWSDGTTDTGSADFTTASVEDLPNLDWTETAPAQEAPDFTLESADFSFDLPASEAGDNSESTLLASNELVSEPSSETSELGLESLDFSPERSSEPSELATDAFPESLEVGEESSDRWDEWADTSQVLGLEEPAPSLASEEVSLNNLVESDFSKPDTISSLADLDFVTDSANPEAVSLSFDEHLEQPPVQWADSSLNVEPNVEPIDSQNDSLLKQPSELNNAWDFTPAEESTSPITSQEQDNLPSETSVIPEPAVSETGGNDAWLAAAGVGAAGLAAGLASSSPGANQEPLEISSEEVASAPAQSTEQLYAELPLLEEQLNVEYQRRKVGEVIIRKQIETRMVQVPVRYEKLVIEQVSPERKSLAEVDLSQGALDNIELTGVNEKPTVSGEFASPAVASQALDAIAKALQSRCKSVRIEIELEDGQMQQAYQEWFDQCSQL